MQNYVMTLLSVVMVASRIFNRYFSSFMPAGTLMVREGSHAAHERFWREVSTMPEAEKAATGDWYLFKPEVSSAAICA